MSRAKKPAVYLAGGFKSGWQDTVSRQLPGFKFLDPSKHGLAQTADYVDWDLKAIRNCDIVLAYMEATNPGGFALALEIGYAKALGKKIVLVESHADPVRERYFDMVRQVADANFRRLEDAISYLALQLPPPTGD